MVGQIVQIILSPAEGVEMPSAEVASTESDTQPETLVLPDGAALLVTGKVLNKLTLGLENLQAMNVVEVEVEHPKTGLQTYRGIVLKDLLNLAAVQPGEGMLVMTASDGFSAEIDIPTVMACDDCLVAIDEDGTLAMVMAGMETTYWVKDVNFLVVK